MMTEPKIHPRLYFHGAGLTCMQLPNLKNRRVAEAKSDRFFSLPHMITSIDFDVHEQGLRS